MVRPTNQNARHRKSTKANESANQDQSSPGKAATPGKSASSSSILIVLFVMVAITWGIAVTAYLGLVDYRTLMGWKEDIHVKTKSAPSDQADFTSQQKVPEPKIIPSEEKQDGVDKSKDQQSTKKDTTTKQPAKKGNKQEKKKNTAAKKKKLEDNPYTSKKDIPILKELEAGDVLIKKKKAKEAETHFRKLIKSHPVSPRARFGLAEALNELSQQLKSNEVLQSCIQAYDEVSQIPNCPDNLKIKALLTKADRQSFLGHVKGSLQTLSKLAREFPKEIKVLNQLGVSWLLVGKTEKARNIYEQVLLLKPDDGFAQTHLGFIVKTVDKDWERGAELLGRGVGSMDQGTQAGKFYFHLGDALHRINKTKKAEEVYELGAQRGMFKSKYQRSLYNVDHLKSRPFWTAKQAGTQDYVRKLEQNWKTIRDEALRVMDVKKGLFLGEDESLKDTGEWRQFTLFARGEKTPECTRVPKTCALVEKMVNAKGCKRGQIKYSVMMPGTHVWPHTGPTNCRLRMHLGLVIPTTGDGARLRCADEYRTWEEGKVMIFDDSFEHEVWQNALTYRLILIVDVWHPDLSEHEKRSLTPI